MYLWNGLCFQTQIPSTDRSFKKLKIHICSKAHCLLQDFSGKIKNWHQKQFFALIRLFGVSTPRWSSFCFYFIFSFLDGHWPWPANRVQCSVHWTEEVDTLNSWHQHKDDHSMNLGHWANMFWATLTTPLDTSILYFAVLFSSHLFAIFDSSLVWWSCVGNPSDKHSFTLVANYTEILSYTNI